MPHRGGLAGDLSLAGGRGAELQMDFACLRVPPVFGAEADHRVRDRDLGRLDEKREDGILAAPSTPSSSTTGATPRSAGSPSPRTGSGSTSGRSSAPWKGWWPTRLLSRSTPMPTSSWRCSRLAQRLGRRALPRQRRHDHDVEPFGIAGLDERYPFDRASRSPGTSRRRSCRENPPLSDGRILSRVAEPPPPTTHGARVDPRVKEDADHAKRVDDFPAELGVRSYGDG